MAKDKEPKVEPFEQEELPVDELNEVQEAEPEPVTKAAAITPVVMDSWYSDFIPTVTKKVTNTAELISALSAANPGDLIELAEGVYTQPAAPHVFMLTRSGTPDKPIVIRAEKGKHAEIKGGFAVRAKDNWLQDLDIHHWDSYQRDQFNQPVNGVNTVVGLAAGLRVINCILREGFRGSAISLWRRNPRGVIYGNIIFGLTTDTGQPHHTYAQNDMDNLSGEGGETGVQYMVRNLMLDSSEASRISFTMRGYGTNAPVSGFHVEQNVSRNGRSLFGCENQYPAYKIVCKKNFYFRSWPELGYHCPGHGQIEDNYIILPLADDGAAPRATFNNQWGTNEQRYADLQKSLAPFSFQRNKIFFTSTERTALYGFRTSRFPTPTNEPVFGDTGLTPTDIVDFNELHGKVSFMIHANGASKGAGTLAAFTGLAETAGCKYDGNSTHDQIMPDKNVVEIIPNEYDPSRAALVVVNWEGATNQNTVLPKPGKVYKAKDSWGLDIAAGTSVAIPLEAAPQLLNVFVIKFDEPVIVEPPIEPPPVEGEKVDLTEEITLAESVSRSQTEAAKILVPIKGNVVADTKLNKAISDQKILIQKLKDKNQA